VGPVDPVFVAGGTQLVGAAILRVLERRGQRRIVGGEGREPAYDDPAAVDAFFGGERPAYVFVAAGRTGGIGANRARPAELMRDNLEVASHVLESAHRHGVRRLLYLASSCSYPRECPQPMSPESLLSGSLEPTSEAYGVAKLAGIALCRAYRDEYGDDFVAAIPAASFGPGDEFGPEDSHVVAALLRRMHEARRDGAPAVTVWGTGKALREFIYVDDLADACVHVMERYPGEGPVNLGGGDEVSIRELAGLVREVTGYRGELRFDAERPDGAPRKVLDSSVLLGLGWRPRTGLREGLERTYEWYLGNEDQTP
jgi:GDP-L-fucose synthase